MEANWLSTLNQSVRVIDSEIPISDYIKIDLSFNNEKLKHIDVSEATAFENYINEYLKQHNAKVAYGGYLEQRNLYKRSNYFNSQDENERNIHLGVDFWCHAGTNVLAAFNGEIHSFKNNTNFGDYGPTIILKHKLDNTVFYTLYGHLSLASIKLKVGSKVKQGETIAALGTADVNGDYAPHLHFQIIKDLQGNAGDYLGVCSKKDLGFYKENCPNPILVFKELDM